MLCILLTSAAWILAALGYGALLRYEGPASLRRAVTGMLGLGVLAVLGIVLHFVTPLNPVVSGAAWLTGAALFWWRRKWLLEGLSRWELFGTLTLLACFVLLMQPPWRLLDAGLYYLQTVKWVTEQRIEIGLVNLHGRLAFNSAWLVLSGLLELPFEGGSDSAYFVNLLPMTFAAAGATSAIGRLVDGQRDFPTIAMALVLIPAAHAAEGLGAQAPDQALTVIVPFTLVTWARALDSDDAFPREAPSAALLSVFATLIKVSASPLALGGVLVLAVRRKVLGKRRLARFAAIAAVAAIPWVARSVLLSGCIVYPAAATCVTSLRWTPDLAVVHAEADVIYAWARRPGLPPEQVLGNWDWLAPWVDAQLDRYDYRWLAAFIAIGLLAWIASAKAMRRSFAVSYALTWGGVVYWFFVAPDPRFAFGFLFALGLLPVALALSRLRGLSSPLARGSLAVAVVGCAASVVVTSGVLRLAIRRPWAIPAVTWPGIPTARTIERITSAGLVETIPLDGDQLCWASPLPCAPSFRPDLGRDWAMVRGGQLESNRASPGPLLRSSPE